MQYHNPFKILGLTPSNFSESELDIATEKLFSLPVDSVNMLNVRGLRILPKEYFMRNFFITMNCLILLSMVIQAT
jgi:hypothetical protein